MFKLQDNDLFAPAASIVGVDHTVAGVTFTLRDLNDHNRNFLGKIATVLGDKDKTPAQLMIDHQVEILIECSLLGWTDFIDRDGNEIEFTRDNAIEILTNNPKLADKLYVLASTGTSEEEVNEAETLAKK